MKPSKLIAPLLIAAATFASAAHAQATAAKPAAKPGAEAAKDAPKVFDVWVRSTVPGASVTGAYMHIKSKNALKLVKVETPLAGMTELHQTTMKDGVMNMSAQDGIDIPAGKLVDLKPGGLHVMLMQLTQQAKKGDTVPLKLTFETADKKPLVIDVNAKVQDKDAAAHSH